jgi:hypothetical protein
VRETKDCLEMYEGPRSVASYERLWGHLAERVRVTLPAHRPVRGERSGVAVPPEERAILETAPSLSGYLAALKQRERGRGTLALRKLLRAPREAFLAALATATEYGLFDLDRVERLVLRNVARDFFPSALLEADTNDHEEPDHG